MKIQLFITLLIKLGNTFFLLKNMSYTMISYNHSMTNKPKTTKIESKKQKQVLDTETLFVEWRNLTLRSVLLERGVKIITYCFTLHTASHNILIANIFLKIKRPVVAQWHDV